MGKVSIIITSRNEMQMTNNGDTVLQRTVRDIYEKATGDFEVLVTFDGPPFQDIRGYPNLTVIKNEVAIGLKPSINKMVEMAKGKYILKTDSHCMFGKGFDEILQADMEEDWIVTPKFFVLKADTWKGQDPWSYDYFYLSCPFTDRSHFGFKAGGHWKERTLERKDPKYDIDETMQIHGSCWFLTKDFFQNKLKGMQSEGYGVSYMEPPELCLKTWLVLGGKVMVNKKTWYAHMHKTHPTWSLGWPEVMRSYRWTAEHWLRNEEPGQIHRLDWLIKKFWPVPTWPDNWRDIYKQWEVRKT